MKVINRPVPVNVGAYNKAIESYISRLKSIRGIFSVNTMGSVNAPGLSDIDIIVVVEDNFCPSQSSELSIDHLDDRLFLHGPVIIPVSMVKDLQYIVLANNIKCILGTSILPDFCALAPSEAFSLSACYLIDFIESRYIQYADVALAGVVNQRAWLTRLWSITHSFSLLKNIGISLQAEDIAKLELIKNIRSAWVRDGKNDISEFINAFCIGFELNNTIFTNVVNFLYGTITDSISFVKPVIRGNKKISFERNLSSPNYIIKNFKIGKHTFSGYSCKQILAYAHHLDGYGLIDSNLNKKMYLSDHFRVMKKRCEIVANHKRWIYKHAPLSKSMTGYLGIKTRKPMTVKSTIRQTLERLILLK